MSLEPDGSTSDARRSGPLTLGALTACYEKRILRFVSSQVENDATAVEVAQDVWVKICQQWLRFDATRGEVDTWVFRIARSVLADHFRRSNAKKRVPDAGPPDSVDGGELAAIAKCPDLDALTHVDERLWLLNALEGLSVSDHALISMYLDGKTTTEIAEHMSKTKRSIDTKLWRIQEQLKKQFIREGIRSEQRKNTGGAA